MSKLSISQRLSERYDRAAIVECFRNIEEQVNGLSEGRMVNRYSAGTAIPTTGSWAKGDILWNSAPATSGVIGWVCVTAGTPGTWREFGFIGSGSATDNAIARWDSAGGLQNSGVTIDDSNNVSGVVALTSSGLLTLNGGQIAFPATQVPSSGANTLDDYEEGSCTLTLIGSSTAGTQTYTQQIGRYLKVGLGVLVIGRLTIGTKDGTTSGNLQIDGLPFTVENVSSLLSRASVMFGGMDLNVAGGYYSGTAATIVNTTKMALQEQGDNVALANLTDADFANGTDIQFTLYYRASA